MKRAAAKVLPIVVAAILFGAFVHWRASTSPVKGREAWRIQDDSVEPATPTCDASSWPRTEARVKLEPTFGGWRFEKATGLYQRPDDPDRWYLLEKRGIVWTFASGESPAVFLDLRDVVSASGNENGLLGLAFHPEYESNGRFFLSYTTDGPAPTSRIAEYWGSSDGRTGFGPGRDLIVIPHLWKTHRGGQINFGPDGFLYASFGDGRAEGDKLHNGQNTYTLLGKIVRIDVDRGWPYAIPSDNPFAFNGAGLPEVFALGFRNPWRFTFDAWTGELWAGDTGQNKWEEVDLVVRGGNYGWREKEGSHCFGAEEPCSDPAWIDPVAEYGHDEGVAIVGGYVYRGTELPELFGAYVYGDHGTGRIWSVRRGELPQILLAGGPQISSFGQGADGELHVIAYGKPAPIYRIRPAETEGAGTLPALLSQTGCVERAKPQKPVAEIVPYDVNVPLWSDGASKRRWMSLPARARIAVRDDGDWDLPAGTVLMKEFSAGGRRIETRLLVNRGDAWEGYSYEWNREETDAMLVPDGKEVLTAEGASWQIPSRAQCFECHTRAAGITLGLETGQLNRDFAIDSGRSGNQIAFLRARGAFEADPGKPARLERAPSLEASASVEARARAYLHANCSMCHRPGGTAAQAEIDLRASISLRRMNLCNVEPILGDAGHEGSRLIAPGDASSSVLLLRMRDSRAGRMPPLATSRIDDKAVALVAEWIESMKTCP